MITVMRLYHSCALLLTLLWSPVSERALAQMPESGTDLRVLMREVCREQAQMLQRRDTRLRYLLHRTDHKGETVRDYIESHDGGVARLLQHNGQNLTAEEDEGERHRLQALASTEKLQDREHDEVKNRSYGIELLKVMPDAMRFTLAPQQVRLPEVTDSQAVIDFDPEPGFHPTSLVQAILPALHGRVWINLADHHLLRMELRNSADVNLAWGLLAKVYAGGTLVYEQRKFQELYTFTHITMHLRVRELMVRTAPVDTETTAANFQRMAASPSGESAISMLLAESVATR